MHAEVTTPINAASFADALDEMSDGVRDFEGMSFYAHSMKTAAYVIRGLIDLIKIERGEI